MWVCVPVIINNFKIFRAECAKIRPVSDENKQFFEKRLVPMERSLRVLLRNIIVDFGPPMFPQNLRWSKFRINLIRSKSVTNSIHIAAHPTLITGLSESIWDNVLYSKESSLEVT